MSRPFGSKNRKEPALAICPTCGLQFKKQGLGTHIREKHKTVYKKEFQNRLNQEPYTHIEPSRELLPTSNLNNQNSQLKEFSPNEIHESNKEVISRSDSNINSYTNEDLFVFQGRLLEINARYDGVDGLLPILKLSKELEIVKQDFYKRFLTTEKHLKTNHPDVIRETKSVEEEMKYRHEFLPYSKLKYSNE